MPGGPHADVHALLFDLDDTLYPERQYVFSGFRAVAEALAERLASDAGLGVSASYTPEELAQRMRSLFETRDRARVFNVLVEQLGCPDADRLVAWMVRVYRSHRPRIALYDDAADALARWRGRAKLGLITDGRAEQQRNKLEALDLIDRFDIMILTDRWGRRFWKPHPRAFEYAAERLGVSGPSCVYVADNPQKDFLAPNALGWCTIQVRRADSLYGGLTPPEGGSPQHIVSRLDEIDSFLIA